ncbi:MAG: RraA family protein [Spirochaetales bacterium]|nr:RraA family protein [Spirochaetales bacterium]
MNDTTREKLLSLYEDLRLCDVRDAMDALGYFHYGSLDEHIRPLYRTRAYGIAKTVRYLPFRGPAPSLSPRKYRDEYSGMYYNSICTYPWTDSIKKGDFIVIDQSDTRVGLIGSENGLACWNKGMSGILTNGGVRDTDELILQNIPLWSAHIAQTMVQVRLEYDAMDIPVAIGGVQIRPGDIIIADGDGALAVPSEIAEEAAAYAREEHEQDKQNRRTHYMTAGLEFDETV